MGIDQKELTADIRDTLRFLYGNDHTPTKETIAKAQTVNDLADEVEKWKEKIKSSREIERLINSLKPPTASTNPSREESNE
jgi:hypothetical protein